MNAFDELLDHLLGHHKICNHPIFHGPNGRDIAWRFSQHLFGFMANGLNRAFGVGATFCPDGHHGRLIKHNTLTTSVDQRVCRSKVNRQIIRKIRFNKTKHGSHPSAVKSFAFITGLRRGSSSGYSSFVSLMWLLHMNIS